MMPNIQARNSPRRCQRENRLQARSSVSWTRSSARSRSPVSPRA
ncbi:Uncharacterised protein [Bordetella pertussis]|nr:Uncharacterised protein [Bordetella pertussis]CFP65311.1 Uncharacterised protein [Bordetella pertussis]